MSTLGNHDCSNTYGPDDEADVVGAAEGSNRLVPAIRRDFKVSYKSLHRSRLLKTDARKSDPLTLMSSVGGEQSNIVNERVKSNI